MDSKVLKCYTEIEKGMDKVMDLIRIYVVLKNEKI